ncbi:MAG: hypothetical protein KDC07_03525 [Chitinophagaceae bacterium]|nr:hypothetical protein [Chitinophagaceae bacterium]MCB9045745.1 hypothetical protein [Chitinophagales bacterium]
MTTGQILSAEMEWLAKVTDSCMRIYFQLEVTNASIEEIVPPAVPADTFYGTMVKQLSFGERLVVALALAPYVKPQLLDAFFIENATYHRRFSEFGGMKMQQHAGFMPTGETAIFLLSGSDMDKRIAAMQLLLNGNITGANGLVQLNAAPGGEPAACGSLTCRDTFINELLGLNK